MVLLKVADALLNNTFPFIKDTDPLKTLIDLFVVNKEVPASIVPPYIYPESTPNLSMVVSVLLLDIDIFPELAFKVIVVPPTVQESVRLFLFTVHPAILPVSIYVALKYICPL